MRLNRSTLKPYLSALIIFLSSRVVMLAGIVYGIKYLPLEADHVTAWNAEGVWYRFLLRYDAGWYFGLANGGYTYNGDDTVPQGPVFYPLYPLLARLVSQTGIPLSASLLLISNLAILVAVPLLFKLIKDEYDETVALYSVALLSFFPTSIFFSAGYTESLTLLLIVVFFLLLKQKRFLGAAVVAGLASATRSTGLVLILPLLIQLWRNFAQDLKRFLLYAVACGSIAASGLGLFILYLWATFNSPFAFVTNLHAWEMHGRPNSIIRAISLQPFYEHLGELRYGPYPNNLDPWVFIAFMMLLLVFRKRLSPALWAYSLGVLLLPYLTRAGGDLGFTSMMRYMLLAFPIFIIMGTLFKNRPWLGITINVVFAGFLGMYSAMYSQWYWIG